MGNVTIWQEASLESSMMAGICHMDPCLGSANRSRRPPCATGRPRSQGFSNAHSEPASVAAVKIAHVRSTSKLASLSFLRNLGGQFGIPRMWRRVRMGGGPPSCPSSCGANRAIEKVLHGGAAEMPKNSPREAKCSRCSKTSSRRRSCAALPPFAASLSRAMTRSPSRRRKAIKPSSRF